MSTMSIYQYIIVAVITNAIHTEAKLHMPIARLPGFQNNTKGVDSGCILILDEKSIIVTELSFDGRCNGATFALGVGSKSIPVSYQYENQTVLLQKDVQLKLPKDLSVYDVGWLSVTCRKRKNDTEYISINPYTFYYELQPFVQHPRTLRSGPILLVNERTIFLSNVYYSALGVEDALFWAGKGVPSQNGTALLDVLGTASSLKTYQGHDVYLYLPKNLTVHDIDYVAVWSSSQQRSYGYTPVSKDVPQLPKKGKGYEDNAGVHIARQPRCCPNGYTKISKGCSKHFGSIKPLPVYVGDLHTQNAEPLKAVVYAPYQHRPECTYGMFNYEADESGENFFLLSSGHLLINISSVVEFFSQDDFCVSPIHDATEGWVDTVYMCMQANNALTLPDWIYNTCICLSTLCLVMSSLIFILIDDSRACRGFNAIGYSVSMTLTFICLSASAFVRTTRIGCDVLDAVFNFFLVASFMWLFFLSYDTFYRVTYNETRHNYNRSYKYSIISVVIPFINMLLSLLISTNREDSEDMLYQCSLTSGKLNPFYYIPIILIIILNAVFLIRTWMYNNELAKNHYNIWPVTRIGTNLKFVYRSCFFLVILMSISWMSEVIFTSVNAESGLRIAFKLINTLQGLFVFLIFATHNPVREVIKDIAQSSYKYIFDRVNGISYENPGN